MKYNKDGHADEQQTMQKCPKRVGAGIRKMVAKLPKNSFLSDVFHLSQKQNPLDLALEDPEDKVLRHTAFKRWVGVNRNKGLTMASIR